MQLRKKLLNLEEGLNVYSQLLKDKQMLEVAEFLKLRILRFAQIPSKREIDRIDIERLKEHLPDTLNTPEANMLLEKAQQVGYLDNRYQPTISNTKSALLAFEIAIRLDIKDKWKTFETFWHRKNMRSYYNNALLQRQSLKFQDEIKQLFK